MTPSLRDKQQTSPEKWLYTCHLFIKEELLNPRRVGLLFLFCHMSSQNFPAQDLLSRCSCSTNFLGRCHLFHRYNTLNTLNFNFIRSLRRSIIHWFMLCHVYAIATQYAAYNWDRKFVHTHMYAPRKRNKSQQNNGLWARIRMRNKYLSQIFEFG